MTRLSRSSLVLWILLSAPGFAAEEPSLEAWMPDDIIGYVKVSDAGARLEEFLTSDLRKDIESLPVVRLGMGPQNWKKALAALEDFRATTGKEPLTFFRDLLGREVLIGARFSFAGPEVIFLTRAAGETEVEASLDLVRKLLGKYGLPTEGVKSTHADRSIETYGDKVSLVSAGSVLAISNSMGAVESVLDLASGKSTRSVSRSPGYRKAAGAFLARSIVIAAVRPQFLPNFKVPEKADNALGSLVAGGWLGAIGSSEFLAASLGLEGGSLELKVSSFGPDGAQEAGAKDRYRSFYPEVIPDRVEERLRKRGVLAFTRITRDLAQWWGDREDLITPGAVGGLIEFAQVMSLAFGGRNFQDEVLPELGSTILLVARNQEYKGMAEKPAPAIPGFAVIFQLKNAKEFGEDMETAFQSIIGLINFDRAQKKKEGGMTMRLKPEKVGDVSLYTVVLKSLGKEEKPGIEHNFTPSLAVVGSRVVLGSSGELTKVLIEELTALGDPRPASAGKTTPRGGAADVIQVDARAALSILSANKDVLVANSMLKEGKTKNEAEGEIQMALDVLQRLLDLRIESGKTGSEHFLTLKLRTLFGAKPAAAGATKEVRL
ncbi:MAG TPA: hypothetical protein VMT52_05500 [Planctomycetota bacterium]|nr:hypothetical protein [Planctomycetota bacterium]